MHHDTTVAAAPCLVTTCHTFAADENLPEAIAMVNFVAKLYDV